MGTTRSNIPKHVIPHTALHGIRLPILVLNPSSSAFTGHLLEFLAQLFVGLGDGFAFCWLLAVVWV